MQQHHRIFELYRNRDEITFKAIARAVKDMDGEDLLLLLLDFADRRSRAARPLAFRKLDEIALWFDARKGGIPHQPAKPCGRSSWAATCSPWACPPAGRWACT